MKKNNTNNTAISIIAVILVFAIVGAAIALTKNIVGLFPDNEKDSEKVTTVPESDSGDTDKPSTDSSGTVTEPEEDDPDFYINELTQTGYHTVDGKTYFFRVYKYNSSVSNVLKFYVSKFNDFDNYSVAVNTYLINNTSQPTWTKITLSADYAPSVELSSSYNHTCYVSYTAIQNCENPSYVLEDLNQNVFFNSDYFEVVRDENSAVG